jgi:hypothetical protein
MMTDITEEIKQFYSQLESILSYDFWNLLKQINPIDNNQADEWQEKIKIERKILSFYLKNGDLSPKIINVNSTGEVNSYPNSNSFNETELDYLKDRLKTSNNAWLKSRYSHILWKVTKNNKFATTSINSYLDVINYLIINSDSKTNNFLSNIVECIIFISEKTKIKIENVKDCVFEIIKSSKIPSYHRINTLEVAFNSKLFKNEDFIFTLSLFKGLIDLKDSGSFFQNQSILNLAIKISEKLNKPTRKFYEGLALNQDLIIEQHPDEKDFIRFSALGDKAKYFKKAGKIKKYNDTLIEYTRLKTKFELNLYEVKFPDDETKLINDYLNRKSELILQIPIEEIFHYFSSSDDLLIKNNVLDKMTEEGYNHSFLQFSSLSVFDINSNHKKLNDEEAKAHERFKTYTIYFSIFVFPLFIKTAAQGIINGKFNYHTIYKFLEDFTWFGQKFDRRNSQIEIDSETNWLSLFAPGLYDFLSQLEWAFIMKTNKVTNFVLCVDSLTLKFEGAIRDFIRLIGGTTTIEKRGELKEQLLEELLQNQEIINHFSEEDITLFKYVFTSSGWNIRNNVAHCFYPYSNYTFDKATLIFLCILRLGKYKLAKKTK